jgi:hypothetical protein
MYLNDLYPFLRLNNPTSPIKFGVIIDHFAVLHFRESDTFFPREIIHHFRDFFLIVPLSLNYLLPLAYHGEVEVGF